MHKHLPSSRQARAHFACLVQALMHVPHIHYLSTAWLLERANLIRSRQYADVTALVTRDLKNLSGWLPLWRAGGHFWTRLRPADSGTARADDAELSELRSMVRGILPPGTEFHVWSPRELELAPHADTSGVTPPNVLFVNVDSHLLPALAEGLAQRQVAGVSVNPRAREAVRFSAREHRIVLRPLTRHRLETKVSGKVGQLPLEPVLVDTVVESMKLHLLDRSDLASLVRAVVRATSLQLGFLLDRAYWRSVRDEVELFIEPVVCTSAPDRDDDWWHELPEFWTLRGQDLMHYSGFDRGLLFWQGAVPGQVHARKLLERIVRTRLGPLLPEGLVLSESQPDNYNPVRVQKVTGEWVFKHKELENISVQVTRAEVVAAGLDLLANDRYAG